MQPENNNTNIAPAPQNNLGAKMDEVVKAAETPAQKNVMTQGAPGKKSDDEKNKMSKKQVIGLVVLSLIAIGGVLFGVYGMNSQNEQIAELTVRATDAEGKVAELETNKITITDPDGGTTEITDSVSARQNPVIKSNDSDEEYTISFDSTIQTNSNANNILIRIKDGDVVECTIGHKEYTGTSGSYNTTKINDCNISGLTGKVYKAVDFWSGQMKVDDYIGFILEDGTVEYFKFSDAVSNSDINVKKLNIDGFVVDAFDVGINPTASPIGGYISTIFVLGNGNAVKYTESML